MFCTLMLDGVPLGQVELTGAPRAIGFLAPLDGYDATGFRAHARRLGVSLTLVGTDLVRPAVVARALSRSLTGLAELQDRLSLQTIQGDHVAIVQVVVVEFPRDDVPVVVAELREQAAPVPARWKLVERRGSESSRPAA